MRIVVFSDTHGKFDVIKDIIDRQSYAYAYIFLGDGVREIDDIKCYFPDKKIYAVCGNCDWASTLPGVGLTVLKGKKIMYTHGHMYNVRYSKEGIKHLARENKADIILFGHTHERYFEYEDGLYVLNPGSASQPRDGKPASYAYIDITDAGVVCNHVDV